MTTLIKDLQQQIIIKNETIESLVEENKRLNRSIEDIKADIIDLIMNEDSGLDYDKGCNDGLKLALARIDKHISGKESE